MRATSSSWKRSFQACLQIIFLLACVTSFSDAGVSCDSDQFCRDLYNTSDTVCLSATKECSNPFQKGCLRSKGLKSNMRNYGDTDRVCTSAEENAGIGTMCKPPDFPYPEIRIHNADWASSFILAWTYQIVLVEILGVPSTVGLTTETVKSQGFYSANNTFEYSSESYPLEALRIANEKMLGGLNCEDTTRQCVHMLPEVWNGQSDSWEVLEKEGAIDPPSSNGIVYKPSLMVPKRTLQEFPIVGNVYGLQDNQQMAQIFKKPTSWVDYCEKVTPEKCSVQDDTASRYPTEEEKSLYFLEGAYKGHFMETDKNKCTASDSLDDCHGYVVGPPCSWTAYLDAQIYWNNIGLQLDSPDGITTAHTYSSMVEIWKAANATGSDVIMWWWLNSIDAQAFGNSSYAPQMVQLPQPTKECLAKRTTVAQRCSADPIERRGSPLGACDQEYSQIRRLLASSVNYMNDKAKEVDQSPAAAMLSAIKVSEFDVREILQKLLAKGKDHVESSAREAVCDWVAQNLDSLEGIVPRYFPKRIRSVSAWRAEHYAAQAVAALVGAVALVCVIHVHKYRHSKTMTFAQPTFLYLILLGFLFICSAALMLPVVQKDSVCLAIKYLEVLGFTVELVPVLIKTAALNKLISSSKKQQRININRKILLRKVTLWMTLVVIWLLVWTFVDPPRINEFRTLNKDDPQEVIIDRECGSSSLYWEIFQVGMELLLLFNCAILAFQTRNANSVVNESRVLGQLVYSHFLFVIVRVLVTIFDLLNLFTGDIIPVIASFNLSFDSLFAMCIYVVPKVIQAKYEPEVYRKSMNSHHVSTRLKTDPKLKILICTANMGNAEPTEESMESWIPTDGECTCVNSLAGATKELKRGYFDIIVIGMQESTWARKATTKTVAESEAAKADGLSEEDILNAMDKHDSATLRLMVKDILGSEYAQIVEELRGQMRLSIWASVNMEENINNVRINGANTGIGNVLNNKGGIVATFEYKTTRLSFISAHLAAHEGENYYKNRLQNIRSILREGKTSDLSSKLDVTMTSHHVFLLGDLNFRTKFEDPDLPHEKCVQRAMNLVDFKDYEGLYMYDELQQGLENGELLHDFETLDCDFPPTFKVEREAGYVYKKQRTPSYTDRILFKSTDGLGSHLQPLAYEPCVDFITSDHKPIRGAFSIIPNDEVKPIEIDGKLIVKLSELEASGLPGSDSSGKADPYVMLMWEGVDFHTGNMTFRDRIQLHFNGHCWPRTKYRNKTLDPVWDGEVINVEADNPRVQKGAFLHVLVLDRDKVGKDGFMCAATLSLWDLCDHETKNHELDIPLTRDGSEAGQIKFKLLILAPRRERRDSRGLRRLSLARGFSFRAAGSPRESVCVGRTGSFINRGTSKITSLFDSRRSDASIHEGVEDSSRRSQEDCILRGSVENRIFEESERVDT